MEDRLDVKAERLARLCENTIMTSFERYREAKKNYWYVSTFAVVMGGLGLIVGLGLQWIFNNTFTPEFPIYMSLLVFLFVFSYLHALLRIRHEKKALECHVIELQRYSMTLTLRSTGNQEVLRIEPLDQNNSCELPIIRNVKSGTIKLDWSKFNDMFAKLL